MNDEDNDTTDHKLSERWNEIAQDSSKKALEIIDEVRKRVTEETNQKKKDDKIEEVIPGEECRKCGRNICASNPECWDHIILDCELCHSEWCTGSDTALRSLERLKKEIEKYELREDKEKWRLSDLYSGMIRWTEKFDGENQEMIWQMLEKKRECEEGRPESKRKSENLGKINSRKIRWIRRNVSDESPEVFSLLQENLALSISSEDYLSEAMTLNQMVTWITQNDPDSIGECDHLWEMQLKADKKKFSEGMVDSNTSVKITLRNMIKWYSKYKPEDEERIYKQVQRLWNLVRDSDLVDQSTALRVASYAPSKKGWSGKLWPFISRRALELVKTTDDPKAIMQLNITLRNVGSEIPSSTLEKCRTDDSLDALLADLIRLSLGKDSAFTISGGIIENEGSEVRFLSHREFTNTSVIQIRGGVPCPEYASIEGDSLVLDLPNILRARFELLEEEERQKELFNQIVECLIKGNYPLDQCWMYISYGLVSDYPQLVRHMLEDGRFNMLFSILDPGIDEDWAFLTFAMRYGHQVASNDWFRSEASMFPEIDDFLKLAKLKYIWNIYENSIEIGQTRLQWQGGDTVSQMNNRMTEIVTGHYGKMSSHIADKGISVSAGGNHTLVIQIVAKSDEGISRLIGKEGRKVKGLTELLVGILSLENSSQIVIQYSVL